MLTKKLICLLLLFSLSFSYNYSYAQTGDYAVYTKAINFMNEGNLLMAYKYLLIYRYANSQRLNEHQNNNSRQKLDREIQQVEHVLIYERDIYTEKKAKGFSDEQIISKQKQLINEIVLKPIVIK